MSPFDENESDEGPAHLSSGWSITVRELKDALRDIPDDYEVMLANCEVDDIEIGEARIADLYPPTPFGSPGIVTIEGGQVVSSEYDFNNRIDASFAFGGQHWNSKSGQWVKQ